MPKTKHILWVDDEIAHLTPHISYLADRGYEITGVANGDDALEMVRTERYDAILLDQIMVGRDGLSTLIGLRDLDPTLPVIMITKSDEEVLMDQAFRGNITDFLIKPISPAQILAALKGTLDREELSRRHRAEGFAQFARQAYMTLEDKLEFKDLIDLYIQMLEWEAQLEGLVDDGLITLHNELFLQTNQLFSSAMVHHYPTWVEAKQGERPILSNDVMPEIILPQYMADKRPTVFVLIDGMRFDQWLALRSLFSKDWNIESNHYLCCLPSSTNYARNALFAGMFPMDIAKVFSSHWMEADKESESLNRYEENHLSVLFAQRGAGPISYFKLANSADEQAFRKRIPQLVAKGGFVALVVNFIDTLTHERARQDIIEVITPDDYAFRRLIKTYIQSSALMEYINTLRKNLPEVRLVITSDHGSTPTNRAVVAYGDKYTVKALRYWFGRDLRFEAPGAVQIKTPKHWGLPEEYMGKSYLIALEDYHFAFSHHIHENRRKYSGIYQHGGISLQEMVLPLATLTAK